MTNSTTLQKIRTLRGDAARLDDFHAAFAEKYSSDARCDKKGYGFGRDGRFAAFNVHTSFDSWAGYYGNSSCSNVLSVSDGKAVASAIQKAMNIHQKELFATAARLLREDAAKLTEQASAELVSLQKLLDEALADQAA